VSSLPAGSVIASDKVNNSVFYAASGSIFYVSKDGGKTFASGAAPVAISSPSKIIAHTNVSGDVWLSGDKGLVHSTDFGASFTNITSVTRAWAIALGAPKTTGGYPALFANAIIGGVTGYFRSDDAGVNCEREHF
jgi:xyloglucan-specific exo-beta-1,4-glucanase